MCLWRIIFTGFHLLEPSISSMVKWGQERELCLQRTAVALNNGPIQAIVHRWTPAPSKDWRAATRCDHLNTRRLTAPSLAQLQNGKCMFCAHHHHHQLPYLLQLCLFIYLIYVGRVLPVHNQLLDGYTRPPLNSTSPKDGWTGPWMRRCTHVHTYIHANMNSFTCIRLLCLQLPSPYFSWKFCFWHSFK